MLFSTGRRWRRYYLLSNILLVESTSKRHSVKYALLLLLSSGHQAINLAKNFSAGTKTVSFIVKGIYVQGWTLAAMLFKGLKLGHLQRTFLHHNLVYLTILRYRLLNRSIIFIIYDHVLFLLLKDFFDE